MQYAFTMKAFCNYYVSCDLSVLKLSAALLVFLFTSLTGRIFKTVSIFQSKANENSGKDRKMLILRSSVSLKGMVTTATASPALPCSFCKSYYIIDY